MLTESCAQNNSRVEKLAGVVRMLVTVSKDRVKQILQYFVKMKQSSGKSSLRQREAGIL